LFQIKWAVRLEGYQDRMATFIYRCPSTGWNVQAHTEDDQKGQAFEVITCIACQRRRKVARI
jgi:hypothetical protein